MDLDKAVVDKDCAPILNELDRPAAPRLYDDEPAGTSGAEQAVHRASRSVLAELWHTKAWRLYPMMLLYVTGWTCLGPMLPTLMTNFFASRDAGSSLQCQELHPEPPPCQNAHSSVVEWSSWSAFVSNSLLSVVCMPLVGEWSDAYGRKPFMAAAVILNALPLVAVLSYLYCGTSLLWYYPVQALQGAASSVSISLALLADLLPPSARSYAFGGLMASFSLGIIVGPVLGGIIMYTLPNGLLVAAWAALGTCAICTLYILLLLPESLKQETRAKARQRIARKGHVLLGTFRAAKILARSSLFRKLTVCLMLSGAVAEGMMELLIQYLQLVAQFQPSDQAKVYVLYGFAALAVQLGILPSLLTMFREKRVLSIGLASSTLQQLLLSVANRKWIGFLAVSLGSLGSVSFPAISSIKSNNAHEHEQGAVQGALYAARAMAMGVGPLIFAGVFRLFSRDDSGLPYLPGAPFIVGAIGSAAALAFSISIERDGTKDVVPVRCNGDEVEQSAGVTEDLNEESTRLLAAH